MKTWRINVWTSSDRKHKAFSDVVDAESKTDAAEAFRRKTGSRFVGCIKTITLERQPETKWGRTGW